MHYLDYAATTPPSTQAIKAMNTTAKSVWGNPSSAHSVGRDAKNIVDECRTCIAKYFSVLPSEVIITGSGTESINYAIKSIATNNNLTEKTKTILTTAIEHKAVKEPLLQLEELGWTIKTIDLNSNGTINLEHLEELIITHNPALITLQWVNSETGLIQPLEAATSIANKHNVLLHTDASQAMPHLAVPTILPDLISFAPHKFYGPKGIGVLIAKKHVELYQHIAGGGQEHGMRSGTENTPAMAGTIVAMQELANEQKSRNEHAQKLREYIQKKVQASSSIRITLDNSLCIASTVNITLQSLSAESAIMKCDLATICISTGSACSSGAQEQIPTVEYFGIPRAQAVKTIRISTGVHTNEKDIDALFAVLEH